MVDIEFAIPLVLTTCGSFEPAEVILPEKAEVDVYVSALDVDHGLEVVGTGLNLMALPGTVNVAHHRFDRRGEYLVVCHEYCGLNHQNMSAKIKVVNHAEYTRWMQALSARVMAAGEKLAGDKDCTSCHTTDGTEGLAPGFKGMYGKREKLTDGRQILVDETYLIESMRSPDKQIPVGYEPGSMPQSALSDDEINRLVAYIKTLK